MSDTLELLPRVTAAFEITTGERYALGVLANLPVLHCVGRRPGVLWTGVMLPVPEGFRCKCNLVIYVDGAECMFTPMDATDTVSIFLPGDYIERAIRRHIDERGNHAPVP